MGGGSYNFQSRSARTSAYKTQSFNQTFEQQDKRRMHDSMDPKKALLREARDSEGHPNSLPIILGLDITGSMGYIPHHLIKDGLPKLISSLQEKHISDAAILFMGLGDSKNDRAPLQVGQFESGDAELDMWLTRTWIESGGGGNGGESYGWAWWFAAQRCKTDAWEKRGQKGFIFTIGDDNCHNITSSEFHEVLGISAETTSAANLYKMASKEWNVYHINMRDRGVSGNTFREYMGEHLLEVDTEEEIPDLIARTISANAVAKPKATKKEEKTEDTPKTETTEPNVSSDGHGVKITL